MSKPIVPWIGGKRRLAKHIIPLLGEHRTYVEPFAGAAAVFFLKEPSKVEVINDINSELMNLYRVVNYHLDELVRHFRWALISREEFLNAQKVDPSTLTDVQRAARFYYLQRLTFGGRVSGQTYGYSVASPPRFSFTRIEEELSQAHFRLASARVNIENLPWDDCIRRYDRDYSVFYVDPPYWQTEGYGVDFPWRQYELIAELARSIKGKMIISHTDHPDIRQLFEGMTIKAVPLKHTNGANPVQRTELIIINR